MSTFLFYFVFNVFILAFVHSIYSCELTFPFNYIHINYPFVNYLLFDCCYLSLPFCISIFCLSLFNCSLEYILSLSFVFAHFISRLSSLYIFVSLLFICGCARSFRVLFSSSLTFLFLIVVYYLFYSNTYLFSTFCVCHNRSVFDNFNVTTVSMSTFDYSSVYDYTVISTLSSAYSSNYTISSISSTVPTTFMSTSTVAITPTTSTAVTTINCLSDGVVCSEDDQCCSGQCYNELCVAPCLIERQRCDGSESEFCCFPLTCSFRGICD